MSAFVHCMYVLRPIWAVLLALLLGSGLIVLADVSPLAAYAELFKGAFLDYWGFAGTLVKMSPILLAGLAVILPMRAGLLNIGAEGQIYMGGLLAAMTALLLPEMPPFIHICVCVLAGAIGGGLWGLIPGYLKAFHGMNEVILTLLMNFIAINIVSYVAGGPLMQEGAPYPYSEEIREDLWLPWILPSTDAHLGVVVGIVLAVAMFFILRYSTVGFAIDAVGKNATAAHYAGIPVKAYVVGIMFFAGALGGLAGAFEVLGLKYRLYHHFSPGYGFDGIVVAFLAAVNPIAAPLAAFFLAGLKAGALVMQRGVGLESTVIEAIQGLVIILVAASLGLRYDARKWLASLLDRRHILDAELGDTLMAKNKERTDRT